MWPESLEITVPLLSLKDSIHKVLFDEEPVLVKNGYWRMQEQRLMHHVWRRIEGEGAKRIKMSVFVKTLWWETR